MDNTQLTELQEARDKLVDKIIAEDASGNVDSLMPLINAIDDVTAAFDTDNN